MVLLPLQRTSWASSVAAAGFWLMMATSCSVQVLVLADHAGGIISLERSEVAAKIPQPLSDHSATLADNKLIYLAGGCNDVNGNTYNQEFELFSCGSVATSFYSFDPSTNEFVTLPEMLRPRFRHAAVAMGDQIWLVGGRTLEDQLVAEVDVFNITAGEWESFTIRDGFAFSDLAFFSTATHAYFAGGYFGEGENYTASVKVFTINPTASNDLGALVLEEKASLLQARGDVAGTVDLEDGYAYVSGGFTENNTFCSPIESVERYDINADSWEYVAPLPTARADKALVVFLGHVLAMGGERQPENICNVEQPAVGELTVPVDDVELMEDDGSEWEVLTSLPEHRFRFAAVVYEDKIYTFGGQIEYDSECNCHKTTDEVVMYEAVIETEQTDSPQLSEDPSGAARLRGISTVVSALLVIVLSLPAF